jgi:hypothetical protein
MDDDQISKAEFFADFFCSPLAKEVYKGLNLLSNNDEIAQSLVSFANKLWDEIKAATDEDDTDY